MRREWEFSNVVCIVTPPLRNFEGGRGKTHIEENLGEQYIYIARQSRAKYEEAMGVVRWCVLLQ